MRQYASSLRSYLHQALLHRRLVDGFRATILWASFFPKWMRSINSNPVTDRQPWMTFEAIEWLSKHFPRGGQVFEYSSGGSTLFYLDRNAKLASVEHDPAWHANIQEILSTEGLLSKCDYRLLPPETAENKSPICPSIRFGDPMADFYRYVSAIDEFPDATFDFISIDGRARVDCARHAIPKVKEGGYLLLDNSDRSDYHEIGKMLGTWKRHEFYGVGPYCSEPWQTTIWQAPTKSAK